MGDTPVRNRKLIAACTIGALLPVAAAALIAAPVSAAAQDANPQPAVEVSPTDASPEAPDAPTPTSESEIPPAAVSSDEVLPVTPRSGVADSTVRLSFAGDVHFADKVRKQAGSSGLRTLPGLIGDSDIAMANLETALTSHGRRTPKEFSFRAPTRVLKTLKSRGIDVVSMANNHALDYGSSGLTDTLRARASSRLPIVGIGANTADAIKPWVKDVRGTSFAYFAGMNAEPLSDEKNPAALTRKWATGASSAGIVLTPKNEAALLSSIREWSTKVDVVVIDMHWGIEATPCPSGRQTSLMARLRSAGADVIVGSHPHVLQGAGFAGSAAVAYSLGNFVWYNQFSKYSAVLNVDIVNGKPAGMSYTPVKIGADGLPRRATGAGAAWVRARMASGARCANLSKTPRA